MDEADVLYNTLREFKKEKEPLRALREYCDTVLGSVERLHFDYKEKRNRSIPQLEDDDKKNLAKAIAGFANAGGGVLIWGIEDKTIKPQPISSIQQFIANILSLAPQITDPVVSNIDGDWIPSSKKDEGIGLVFIPESAITPHRVILNHKEVQHHYFIRSGDSFIVASHTMLEDMFGRRPKPKLELSTRMIRQVGLTTHGRAIINVLIILGIENQGRGSAKSPMLAVKVGSPYAIYEFGIDGNRNYGLPRLLKSQDLAYEMYGAVQTIVIHPGVTHDVTALRISVELNVAPSTISDLILDYKIAAEGIQLIEDTKIITGNQIYTKANEP